MKPRQMKLNAFSQAQLIKLLLDGAYSCAELAEQTGLHYVTVLQYTRELYRAGAAHICMWEKDARGRALIKIYKLGKGKDAKRDSIPAADRQRVYRKRCQQQRQALVLAGQAKFVKSANGKYRFEPITGASHA